MYWNDYTDWNEKKYRIWFLPTSGISSCGISQSKITSVNWLLCYRFFNYLEIWSCGFLRRTKHGRSKVDLNGFNLNLVLIGSCRFSSVQIFSSRFMYIISHYGNKKMIWTGSKKFVFEGIFVSRLKKIFCYFIGSQNGRKEKKNDLNWLKKIFISVHLT